MGKKSVWSSSLGKFVTVDADTLDGIDSSDLSKNTHKHIIEDITNFNHGSTHSVDGSDPIPVQPSTSSIIGGIISKTKTKEYTEEVKIGLDNKLYVKNPDAVAILVSQLTKELIGQSNIDEALSAIYNKIVSDVAELDSIIDTKSDITGTIASAEDSNKLDGHTVEYFEPSITKKTGFNLDKSDSTATDSSSILATSKAVKTSMDKAKSAYTKALSNTTLANSAQTAANSKVDKIVGKELSANDFTDALKTKLAEVATNANKYIHPSSHPVDIIIETNDKQFISATEKDKLTGIATNANKYVHPSSHSANMILEDDDKQFVTSAEKAKIGKIENEANKYIHPTSHSANIITETDDKQFMSSIEKNKLDGIEDEANKYVHPYSHNVDIIIETDDKQFISATEKDKLGGIATNANKYVHPASHPTNIITETDNKQFISSVEKEKLSNIATNANKYIHPSSHPVDIIIETNDKQFISATEKDKLTGIATNANKYVHPSSHGADIITETDSKQFISSAEKDKLNKIKDNANKYVHPSSHSVNIITETDNKQFISSVEKDIWNNKADKNGSIDENFTTKDLTVSGNLNIEGTSTIINSQSLGIKDNTIILNSGETGKGVTKKSAGIIIDRGIAENYNITFDEIDNLFKVGTDNNLETIASRTWVNNEIKSNKYVHPSSHSVNIITETDNKQFISSVEKNKLSKISNEANKYTHPSSHNATIIIETNDKQFISATEKAKLTGIATNANKYAHPNKHPASIITETDNKQFISSVEKNKLSNIATNANKYIHPNKHPVDIIIETDDKQFISATEKDKLGGIATNANKYIHPANHDAGMITQSETKRFVSDAEKTIWSGKENSIAKKTAFNKDFGTVEGSVCKGNDPRLDTSTNAVNLKTPRNISLSGLASGSVNFDGTKNVTIPVVLKENIMLGNGGSGSITQTSGTWWQKFVITDTDNLNDHLFQFLERQGSGDYKELFGVDGNGIAHTKGVATPKWEMKEGSDGSLQFIYNE